MRVEHDDVGARLGVDRQLHSGARVLNPSCTAQLARRRPRARCGAAPESAARSGTDVRTRRNACEHRRFLAFHRAAGDDDRTRSQECGSSAARDRARATEASACDRSSESNFRLPVTVTRPGLAPEIDEAARRLFALHAEAVDVVEHAPHEPAHQAIARIRALRQRGR